jgi:2-phospho-L-lactate guanylyltransferase (CobY/MobA/RfbA family)
MLCVVIPFRGESAKSRLGRPGLAKAMLADVLAAAGEVGTAVVANGDGGQGEAVAAALAGLDGPVLVVNADLPCATGDDLRALVAATPEGGLAIVPAADGTTNAISLSSAGLFEPLYGPGSAERFRGLGAVVVSIANLEDDVDTADDLARVRDRVGGHTRDAL